MDKGYKTEYLEESGFNFVWFIIQGGHNSNDNSHPALQCDLIAKMEIDTFYKIIKQDGGAKDFGK